MIIILSRQVTKRVIVKKESNKPSHFTSRTIHHSLGFVKGQTQYPSSGKENSSGPKLIK